MKEYEIYVPLFAPSGKKIPAGKLRGLKRRLVKQFGGLTSFPQKIKGVWKTGGAVFHDDIVILRVLSSGGAGDRAFLKQEQQDLKARMNQSDVLIIARTVTKL